MSHPAPNSETVGVLGEREVLRRLSRWMNMGRDGSGDMAGGDDCAELHCPPGGGRTVLTTDLLVENVHFLRNAETRWALLGRKAAAANISDLAAAGAVPRALLIGISLPSDILMHHLEELYRGISETTKAAGAAILGGDTTRGEHLVISVTAVGWKDLGWSDCLRSSAMPGDFLYITGPLGGSRAGLELLLKPDLSRLISPGSAKALICRHFAPPLRIGVGLSLSRSGNRTALIDISDSLCNEAALLSEASGVQVELWIDKIAVHPDSQSFCVARGLNFQQYALFSGEEYELLISSPLQLDELDQIFQRDGVICNLTHVGTVNPGSGVLLMQGGHPVDPSDETFNHFT